MAAFGETLRARKLMVMAGIASLFLAAGAIVAHAAWEWAFHDLPPVPETAEDLWRVRMEPTVTLLDSDGAVLAIRGPLYGMPARLDDLPPHVAQAFLSIEDRRYFDHDGVDWRGTIRAMLANVRAGRTVQGGSTITMQLVKNLILTPERTMRRKIQEMRLAMALERVLTKEEILELYLNRIYFGEQAYGIEAAARRYFNKPASELTVQEAALLAALPAAPTRLAPTDNLAEAQARATNVLSAMRDAGFLSPMDYIVANATQAEPVESAFRPGGMQQYGHLFDYAVTEAQRLLGPDNDVPDLVIETTLDTRLQNAAQEVVTNRLERDGPAARAGEAAAVVLDSNGAVRAMIGGRDYVSSQFNRAIQARRQPGSAFKPFVYLAALEADYSPSSVFNDTPVTYDNWSPVNFGGGNRGQMTMEDALKRSVNTIAAQVGMLVGISEVAEMARRMGITTPLNEVPSLSLGSSEVRVIDMAASYLVIANDGRRLDPYFVTTIRTTRGDVLYKRPEETRTQQVIARGHARAMSTMLQAVVLDGTGRRAAVPGHRVAGKTGTSQNSRDAWFVGYSAQYAAAVWTGNDDDSAMANVTGGGLPADIWREIMVAAHEGERAQPLAAPAPRVRSEREERLVAFYSGLSADFDRVLSGGRLN
ncbi:MAG: transglycosylase domain-containing protein [Glycocaulis sp.]